MKLPGLFLFSLLLMLGACSDNDPSTLTNYKPTAFTGFVINNNHSSILVYTEDGSLISFSTIEEGAELGDRVIIDYDEVAASFPGQANAKSMEIVSPPKPDGASRSEKEAIAIAYDKIAHLPAANEHLDHRYVTHTAYQEENDMWMISIHIYGEDKERIIEVN